MIENLIRKSLEGLKAKTILDIGPGYAGFSRISAELTGARAITFVDADPDVLRFQKEQCTKYGIEARFESLDFSESGDAARNIQYDVIHCQEVLEHLEQPQILLSQLSAALAPGGRIIVTVPSRVSERWLKFLNPGYMRNEPHGHVQEFTREDLLQLSRRCDIRVLSIIPAQPHYFFAHTWMALTRMKVEGATGQVLTGGVRGAMFDIIVNSTRRFFGLTGIHFWSSVFPRNYFLLGERAE